MLDQKTTDCQKIATNILHYVSEREDDWSIPINIQRVKSSDSKYSIGVKQILDAHSCSNQEAITVWVGDAA